MSSHLLVLLLALVLDWLVGDPDWLWQRIAHPVVWFGTVVGFLDQHLNKQTDTAEARGEQGTLAFFILIAGSLLLGGVLQLFIALLGPVGWLLEAAIVTTLLAQKSMLDHVRAVAEGLRHGGLEGGQAAVAKIVGRDPKQLDRAGVSRAAIESLAENFSDGVVAPVFWYGLAGLPGILAYKMLNTADSMIGHKSEKYLEFGRWSARADDFANWLPARLSLAVIILAVLVTRGWQPAQAVFNGALHDARLHRSPNAGWPEAAFAHGLEIALGGPRAYGSESVQQSWINASGKTRLDAADIEAAMQLFACSCFALWAFIAVLWLLA